MSNDILESVSQRGYGAYDAESPMNSKDFADYMRHNLEQAKKIEAASK